LAGFEIFKETSNLARTPVGTDVNGDAAAGRPADAPAAYEFGPYRLERATRRLLRAGAPVALTPKAFDTLLALIDRRDRVVEKAELMKVVWPDSFVEDSNLSQTIFVLRKTLGEAPDGRPFIDTVPRRGYRFAAIVTEDTGNASVARGDARPWRARGWRIASIVFLVALAGFGTLLLQPQAGALPPVESLAVLPFEDLSSGGEGDSLAESITDALITKLGQIGRLRVVSRTSAATYEGPARPSPRLRAS
jgi:DNA-binding winged helix-turn-helix (wHTH) protein